MIALFLNSILNTFLSGRVRPIFGIFEFCWAKKKELFGQDDACRQFLVTCYRPIKFDITSKRSLGTGVGKSRAVMAKGYDTQVFSKLCVSAKAELTWDYVLRNTLPVDLFYLRCIIKKKKHHPDLFSKEICKEVGLVVFMKMCKGLSISQPEEPRARFRVRVR